MLQKALDDERTQANTKLQKALDDERTQANTKLQKALDDERFQADLKLQRALCEKTQMQTRLHEMWRQKEAQLEEMTERFKLRQQEPAKRPACALSEVLKKEVSEVLLHAKTLPNKEGKDFIMKLRLKFHPGEFWLHEGWLGLSSGAGLCCFLIMICFVLTPAALLCYDLHVLQVVTPANCAAFVLMPVSCCESTSLHQNSERHVVLLQIRTNT